MTKSSKRQEFTVLNACRGNRAAGEWKVSKFPCSNCKKECLSELLGTYVLVLTGPASIILAGLVLGPQTFRALGFVALSFGGTVAGLTFFLGKYSGAIINPALTIGAKIAGLLEEGLLVPFLFFQTLGGILAGLTLRLSLGAIDSGTNLGSTKFAFGLSPALGFSLETAGTFALALSALITSFQFRSLVGRALFVGCVLFILIILIGPFTGAGFNPARSLGPALASGYFGNLGLYLLAPCLGASAAGFAFRLSRSRWAKNDSFRLR